jgi:hypothetical protein
MPEPSPGRQWRIEDDGIVLAGILEISLQRTLPRAMSSHDPPPSYGRAPLAAGPDVVFAGIGSGELFWIGFQPLTGSVQAAIRARSPFPRDLDLVTGEAWKAAASHDPSPHATVPPLRHLGPLDPRATRVLIEVVGVRRRASTDPPARADETGWTWLVDAAVRIDVVSAAEFARITGTTPRPLKEGDRYHGRRYP